MVHNSFLRTFIDDAPAAIAMFDRNMRYIAASKRWLSDFNLGDRDLAGRSHYEIFPEISMQWREVHARCLAGATERADAELFVRSDGSQQWITWEVRPWFVTTEPHKIGGLIIFSEDVTRLQKAHMQESALQAKTEVEKALRIEAEQSSKAKDDFMATLSHELRTPLNALLCWVELLKKNHSDPERVFEGVKAIEQRGQALSRLISDMLDINRAVSGKLRLTLEDLEVGAVIDRACAVARPLAEAKQITLKQSTPSSEAILRGDAARLQQCLWNLLSNAIKFTPRNGCISVSVEASDDTVKISVEDTGPGIPAEALPRIFDRFVQADATSTRSYGGLGLGLAITRHLVELHGGTIDARTKKQEQGSTFTITLPIARGGAARVALTGIDGVISDPNDFRGLTCIIVDDEIEARELLREHLEDLGARVYAAPSAASGSELARSIKPDLIISDIAMPHQDGYQFVSDLRAQGIDVPAIALTAFSGDTHERRAREAGFSAQLTKPVDVKRLCGVISTLWERTHSV